MKLNKQEMAIIGYLIEDRIIKDEKRLCKIDDIKLKEIILDDIKKLKTLFKKFNI